MTSTSVGNAVSVISDVTVTVPPGFITSEDKGSFSVFHNKQTNEVVRVRCLDDAKSYVDKYNSQLETLKGQDDIKITKKLKNDTLAMIEYENQSSTDKKDITLVYFDKCEHTFSMQLEHFTEDSRKEYVIDFIMDTMKYDFKQHVV